MLNVNGKKESMFQKFIAKKANFLTKLTAVIIFSIIIVYYGITIALSGVMNKQIVTVMEHPYQVVLIIGDVKADLTLLRALPERLEYVQTVEMVAGIAEHYERIDQNMIENISNLKVRYLADTFNVGYLENSYKQLFDAQKELLAMVQNSETMNVSGVMTFYNTSIVPKLNDLDAFAEAINAGAGRKLQEYGNLAQTSKNIMLIMATILSVAVVISIGFYLIILHQKHKIEEETNAIRTELMVEQGANAAKSQFLFNMSHDIRTPMNAIIGLTAIAAMDIDKKEKVKDCLTKITSSSRHLLGLINDVLDMSRIESGKVSLNEEFFILPDLIDDFINVTQTQADEKGLNLEINVSDIAHERVIGDSVQIKRIMSNIAGNALKFTPEGGEIRLTVRELPPTIKGYGSYQFVMKDTGIGMTESFLKKIFQPFERAETSTKSRVEGTGLGMAITKNIVDMMGGQIDVVSELGKGSTLTVTLPIKLQSVEEEMCDFSKMYDLRSLVVDDDEIACEATVRLIQDIGMNCEGVLSGKQAVQLTKEAYDIQHDYHVVIVDWKMPGMDGLQTTRAIRKIVGDKLPIIVLTAYDWSDIETEAKAAGVNAFLSKPVFKSRLCHVMQNLSIGNVPKIAKEEKVLDQNERRFSGRILLVEDNEINMEIAEEFISYFGVTIEKVWNGLEALERIKAVGTDYYDLVFMDIQMPKMDGYEATKQIRKFEVEHGTEKRLPIVAMSANAFIEEVNKGYASGMDSYVTKPVEMETLCGILKKYLKKIEVN